MRLYGGFGIGFDLAKMAFVCQSMGMDTNRTLSLLSKRAHMRTRVRL